MPRSIAVIIGFFGLVAAVYVAFHRSPPVLGVEGRQLDGPLFGIAIAAVSILLLASALRGSRTAAASQSFDSM